MVADKYEYDEKLDCFMFYKSCSKKALLIVPKSNVLYIVVR